MPTARKLASGSWRCKMYSHTEYTKQPDGTYKKRLVYVSFTCDDKSKKGKSKCERMAADWKAKKENRQPIQVDLTFDEAMQKYMDLRKDTLSPSTSCGYFSLMRKLQNEFPDLCVKKVCQITTADLQQAINRVTSENSPKTVRNVVAFITPVMHQFRPDFSFHLNLPQKKRPDLYVPSDDDIRHLIDAVTGTDLELPVLLAAFGPMRRGEICALDTKNISGNIVHVCENMVQGPDRTWVVKAPKSYAGDRYIAYPDFVAAKWTGIEGRVTEYTPNNLGTQFGRVLRKNNLPHFRFHDLRHYSASIQHALGIPDAYIMQRGGWSNDGVLKSVYRHAMDQEQIAMSQKANDHFSELYTTKYTTK